MKYPALRITMAFFFLIYNNVGIGQQKKESKEQHLLRREVLKDANGKPVNAHGAAYYIITVLIICSGK